MIFSNNLYFQLANSQLFPSTRYAVQNVDTNNKALQLAAIAQKEFLDGEHQKARKIYSEAIELFPDQPFFYACRSMLNEAQGDGEGAFYDYQVAKRLDFNYHIFLEWIENQPETITDSFDFKDDVEAMNVSLARVQEFDYKGAIIAYTKALSSYPEHADMYVFRGAVFMRLLQYDLALNDFNRALSIKSDSYQALLSRAKLYSAIRSFEEAEKDFNQAVAIAPLESVVYEERAVFRVEQKAYDAAIDDYNKLVNLLPDDFYVFTLRADLLERMEQWEQALQDYDRAIVLNPYYSDLYVYRGEIKERLGDFLGAEADRKLGEEIDDE